MFGITPFARVPERRSGREFDQFSNLIDEFFNDSFFLNRNLSRDTFKLDIKEDENAFTVFADLPGVAKEDIHLEFDQDILVIKVERKEEKNEDKEGFIHRERRLCSMQRSINLGKIDKDAIAAKLEHGVLEIHAPKLAEVKTKTTIQIK